MTGQVLIDPLPNHAFSDRDLARWLEAIIPEARYQMTVQQFQGGMSNPNFLLMMKSGTRYVLRKKPYGELLPRAHAIDREYRIMAALADAPVPVPRMIAYCRDASVIGTEFFVMSFVEGRIFSASDLSSAPSDQRREIQLAFTDILADLHSIDFHSIGLAGYGRSEKYLLRQVSRWAQQHQNAMSGLRVAYDSYNFEWLRDWLLDHSNVSEESAITHGDFRSANIIVNSTSPSVAALLDWELSTIGNPFVDLAYLCLPYRLAEFMPEMGSPLEAGLPSESEILARYCLRTGRKNIPDWSVFLALGCLRYAAIVQGVASRACQGNVSTGSVDPQSVALRAMKAARCGVEIARANSESVERLSQIAVARERNEKSSRKST